MPDEIAVMKGADGRTAAMHENGTLAVFQRGGCQCSGFSWRQIREKTVSMEKIQGIKELREKMAEIVDFMGDCRVLITRNVTGVAFFELEKAGFNVWEAEGEPSDCLDQIEFGDSKQEAGIIEENAQQLPVPLEVFPGCYRISLAEIQQNHAGFTSKQVLLPFFRKESFNRLEVLCDHVPPWLEAGLISGEYTGSIEACSRGIYKITIVPAIDQDLLQPVSKGMSE